MAESPSAGGPSAELDASLPAQATPEPQLGIVAEPMDDAAYLFDQDELRIFDVEIEPADLMTVNSNPKAEQYVPAVLHFEGQTYPIGYRYKGSLGAFFPPCTGLGGAKAGKCSIKLSFSWPDPEGRFFGLKKLLFHAMNNDPSMMRERLGYGLFREMGVPASRASHAILRVNGQADIYALVEQIDGRFTRSRFAEGGKGNLYKEIWPVHEDAAAYLAALETNEDEDPSAERVLRFRDAVLEGPDSMAAWMDLDVTTSYMAVDRMILNDDGAFHFYCFPNAIGRNPAPPGNHNYYWYEAQDIDHMWIIPWDLDMCMMEADGPAHLPMDWRTDPAAGQCDVCATGGLGASPVPGCDPVIRNFQAWQQAYDAKIDAFIAGPFDKAAVDGKLDRWTRQLTEAGFPPPQAQVDALKAVLDRSRENRGFVY